MSRSRQLGLLLGIALAALPACRGDAPPPKLPDITLISLDTVRQDRGPGPWGPGVMPNLSAFAQGATRYTEAWAPSSNTLVSHGSLFTGRPPWAHGFHPTLPPPAEAPDLLPRLAARGYTVAVFTTHPLWLGHDHHFDAGASTFRAEATRGEDVLTWVQAWLATAPPPPRALFVHLYDAHSDTHHLPYEAPVLPPEALAFDGCVGALCASRLLKAVDGGAAHLPPGAEAAVRAQYDAGVAHTDALLGALLTLTRPVMGDGFTAVFADHGELLGEGGRWLHHGAQPAVLDIPLVVKAPGQTSGAVVDTPVGLIQLYGTVLSAAGQPTPGLDAPAGPVLAMGAARRDDLMVVEAEGGGLGALRRGADGRWIPADVDPWLARMATNPLEAPAP